MLVAVVSVACEIFSGNVALPTKVMLPLESVEGQLVFVKMLVALFAVTMQLVVAADIGLDPEQGSHCGSVPFDTRHWPTVPIGNGEFVLPV